MNRGESLLPLYCWLQQQHLSVNPQPLEVPPMVGFRLVCVRQVGKVKGVSEGLN